MAFDDISFQAVATDTSIMSIDGDNGQQVDRFNASADGRVQVSSTVHTNNPMPKQITVTDPRGISGGAVPKA